MPNTPASQRPICTTAVAAILFAATATGLAACGVHTGAFQNDSGSPNCQVHQSNHPSTAYTGGTKGDTLAILTMMHYYTAHRAQPFCDGHPATATDKDWTALYTRLSAG